MARRRKKFNELFPVAQTGGERCPAHSNEEEICVSCRRYARMDEFFLVSDRVSKQGYFWKSVSVRIPSLYS